MIAIDHEFKLLLAPLTKEELAGLEEDILRDGCRVPLDVWRGTLIDGHNRHEICTKHGLSFEVTEREFDDREAVKTWIIRNQLNRRNQTPEQTSYYRGKLYEQEKKIGFKGNQYTESASGNNYQKQTADRIAEQYGVTEKTIRNDAAYAAAVDALADATGEDVRQQVLTGELPVTKKDIVALAAQSVEKQKAVISKLQEGEARSFRDAERLTRKAEVAEAPAMPSGKHRVIYADPPWKYGDGLTESYGGTQYHYPSMSIEELCEIPVREMVEDNAVLFLWVTSPLLEECFPVIKAWGFKYKASFVWDKIKHNMGHYNSVRHEFLLICTRGSCTPDEKTLLDSVQSIERTNRHSEKPQEFRCIIETLYKHGSRLELFARQDHEGWTVYGNQLQAVS